METSTVAAKPAELAPAASLDSANLPSIGPVAISGNREEVRQGRIEVVNVSKKFTLQQGRAGDLRELVTGLGKRRTSPPQENGNKREGFWALRDVSFEVHPGQPVGIIGHNGSGKSTMLKLLTGILKPTHGEVKVSGRIGALIEVGAGFHPDLSGRENVYLNGSILRLSRREIDRKLDDIVSFAGLEAFIDTPVKRYSSGMYMRLGFAVAAHTDPDILLIDEVLAVGDQQFQNKCMAHLKGFVKQGGAVVFVGHAMGQVQELCKTVVLLDHGQVREIGPAPQVVESYLELVAEREEEEFKRTRPREWAARKQAEEQAERERQEAEEKAKIAARLVQEQTEQERQEAEHEKRLRRADPTCSCITSVRLENEQGELCLHFEAGSFFQVRIGYRFAQIMERPIIGVDLFRMDGLHMFTTSNFDHDINLPGPVGTGEVLVRFPMLSLGDGKYRVRVTLFGNTVTPDWFLHPEDELEDAARFHVDAGRFVHGCVYLPVHWPRVQSSVSEALHPESLRDNSENVAVPVSVSTAEGSVPNKAGGSER